MTSEGTTRPATPANPGIRRQSTNVILLGGGVDSDGEEEAGTPLTEIAAALSLDNTNTEASRRNGDQRNKPDKVAQETPLHRSTPKSVLNANRILDWLLGRHVYSTPEDLTNDAGSRRPEHKRDIDDDYFDIGDVQDICPACTTPYCQAIDSIPFKSSLKLMYNDPMSEKWLIGNKFVLHEAVDDHPEDEYVPLVEASRALQTLACNVPMPKVRAGWKDNGKVVTISDAVPGERLYDIWWDLSSEAREHIAAQVAQYVEAWRATDLGRISGLTGGPVHHHDNLLGPMEEEEEEGFGPFGSDLELWQAIEGRLEKKGVVEATIHLLRDRMPASAPCVLTHGDLSSANIIVRGGEVAAIAGLEHAASLPVWAEDVAMRFCSCPEDEQWKATLVSPLNRLHGHFLLLPLLQAPETPSNPYYISGHYLTPVLYQSRHTRSHHHRAALDWWALWTAAEDADPADDERLLSPLKTRCRRWEKTEAIFGPPFRSIWLGHDDGGPAERPNIQTAGARVADLADDYVLRRGASYGAVPGDASWGCSADEEEEDGRRGAGRRGRGRGLAPFHPAQRQHHHTLATSADGAEDEDALRSPERSTADGPARTPLASKGLRPLSLPALALSSGTLRGADGTSMMREEPGAAVALVPIREDGAVRAKRTSMFGRSRGAPGSLYARLSAASASAEARPRRHGRSRSEERTWLGGGDDDVRVDASRGRPQSMLQPSVRRDGG
ncbi:hypothetical protein F4823DRAFT_362485 [Ustulina deusta]|nr:hypothetical protein F4823DRAFT_362485 [Ustulina deusta]